MVTRYLAVSLTFVLPILVEGKDFAVDQVTEIDAFLDSSVREEKIPGVVAIVVTRDKSPVPSILWTPEQVFKC